MTKAVEAKTIKGKARQVEFTSEYGVFERLPGNRKIDSAHVKALVMAMQENYIFSPILVNQDFQVLDGQHRLEAHRQLGIPVPYFWDTVEGGLRDVQNLNSTQKRWSNEDYVESYIEQGKQDYITYKWFKDTYGLTHSVSTLLLGGGVKARRREFVAGLFKVKNLELAKKKAGVLKEVAPHFSHWRDDNFMRAMNIALTKKGFEVQTFLHKVATNPTMLQPCVSVDQYLSLIEEVYNFRSTKKVAVKYGQEDEQSKWKS